MSQQIPIEGNDLCAAVQAQRNDALDAAANNGAAIQTLLRVIAQREQRIAELEKKLADASKPEATQDAG